MASKMRAVETAPINAMIIASVSDFIVKRARRDNMVPAINITNRQNQVIYLFIIYPILGEHLLEKVLHQVLDEFLSPDYTSLILILHLF